MEDRKIYFTKLVIQQHPLISTGTEFSLSNVQPIKDPYDEPVTHIYGRRYLNNVTTIVGRNATGKTTLMTAVVGLLFLFWGNRSIDQTPLKGYLFGEEDIQFDVYFYGSDKYHYKDSIVFTKNDDAEWYISSEIIRRKKSRSNDSKTEIFNFKNSEIYLDRKKLEGDASEILAGDDSIFRLVLKRNNFNAPTVYNSLIFTDNNTLIRDSYEIPVEILEYLDPSVESLKIEDTNNGEVFRLKFKNNEQEIVEHKFSNLQHYLSSGTSKGVTLFQLMLSVLKSGGYLFIDEIENHFNQAIVRTFINFFADKSINKNDAFLIFSTHYSELLEDLRRGDQIFIAKKDKKTVVTRYSSYGIRADFNRTDVFNSNYIEGSAPEYKALINLKRSVIKAVSDNG